MLANGMGRDIRIEHLKKILLLETLVRSGSFKKTAQEAGVTPSAVSQAISHLERELGRPLLARKRGSVVATPEALAMIETLKPAFAAFERLRELRATPPPSISRLNFGTYESLAVDVLPPLIHRLERLMPHLRLALKVTRSSQLLSLIRKGELCSALVTENDALSRFKTVELDRDRLGFFGSRRIGPSPSPAILSRMSLGGLAPGSEGLPRFYTRFARSFEMKRPLVTSDSFETLRAACSSGALICILPARVARRTDDLIEITHLFKRTSRPHDGSHGIHLASLPNCDPDEIRFLSEEVGSILRSRGTEMTRS